MDVKAPGAKCQYDFIHKNTFYGNKFCSVELTKFDNFYFLLIEGNILQAESISVFQYYNLKFFNLSSKIIQF